MAVSRDDSSIAIGFGKTVVICDVSATRCDTSDLTDREVREQVINYSQDSNHVVVAYRYASDNLVNCKSWKVSASPSSEKSRYVGIWKKVSLSLSSSKHCFNGSTPLTMSRAKLEILDCARSSTTISEGMQSWRPTRRT